MKEYEIKEHQNIDIASEPVAAYSYGSAASHFHHENYQETADCIMPALVVLPNDVKLELISMLSRSLIRDFAYESSSQRRNKVWASDLDKIASLPADWDAAGADAPNAKAIANCRIIIYALSEHIDARDVSLSPTELGAIAIEQTHGDNILCGEIGDNYVSYFVRRKGTDTEYHNLEPINSLSINTLRKNMEEL